MADPICEFATGRAGLTEPFLCCAAINLSAAEVRLADLNLDVFEQVGRKADPWTIVRAGAVIDFAGTRTAVERVARIQREREEREQRGASVFTEEYRRTYGIGRPKAKAAKA